MIRLNLFPPAQTTPWFKSIMTVILVLTPVLLSAQTLKEFPADTAAFPEALTTYMGPNLNETDLQTLNTFLSRFRDGTFSEEEKNGIIDICNRLKGRKARGVPYFTTYLQSTLLFKEKNIDPDGYAAWEESLADLITTKRTQLRYILRFLRNTVNLLTDFTLFKSTAVMWRVDSTSMSFQYDKNDLQIVLGQTVLHGYAQRDSIEILKTTGIYFPSSVKWAGRNGHVTWERAGYTAGEVWADLPRYTIDLTKSTYSVDSALFMNTTYFKQPVRGAFTDKIMKISQPSRAVYPKFTSYEQVYRIENIQKGIHYTGGLSMSGAVVKGTGTERFPAMLQFFREDSLQLIIRSESFSFRKERYSSLNCSMTFLLDEDSIFHPNTAFIFNLSNREVDFYQTDNLLTHAPFYDSYHKINARVNSFIWNMEDSVARLTRLRGTTIGEADFWSLNFFNNRHFYSLQGMDEMNPLQVVKKFTEWYYRDEFPVGELAKWMGMPEHTARRMLVQLALEGFIFYNPETGEAKVKKELYDYLEAFAGHIDYDVMMFKSKTNAPVDNALLNLNSKELTINGVPSIYLSDSQNVVIIPSGNKIRMSRNRSFNFDGVIRAGFAIYSGKNFFFNYDSFKIEMYKIDSLTLWAYGDQKDNLGRPVPEKIHNIVEVITGSLFIDKPDNKAGLKRYSEYPFFRSSENSYVYYQESSVYDSVYSRDRFRFVIQPFTLSNLDHLTKEELQFSGAFTSGGIFPDIPQKLIVQEDNSLGFTTEAPADGFPVYDGKGRFYNLVQMSNQGLIGSGKLDHLTTTFGSDKYVFFPDSMVAVAHDFHTNEQQTGVLFPEVTGKDADLRWYPHRDSFLIRRKSENFQVFASKTAFQGDLLLTPTGMNAGGRFIFPDAGIRSDHFILTDHSFTADTAGFVIFAEGQGDQRLQAAQVSATVDVNRGMGVFNRLNDTLFVSFPENQYITSLDNLSWDIKNGSLGLVNKRKSDDPYLLGSDPVLMQSMWQIIPTFVSLNPKTDTLGFASDSALYDISTHKLTTYNVPQLEIADAIIYPVDGEVEIERNGNTGTLEDARIIANGTYELDSAKVNIFSRKDYYGSGTYTYTMVDGTRELIFFSNISVDDSLHTYADAEIPDENHFLLSPAFEYRGKVSLYAKKPFLTFSGGARIIHNCERISRNYLEFSEEIDPEKVMIPVPDQPVSDNNVKIYNGLYITIDSTHIYPAFLSRRLNYSDTPVSTASGYLVYDATSGEYRIGNPEKLSDTTLPGRYLAFNRNECSLTGEGPLDLGVDFGQVKLVSAGRISQDFDRDTVVLDAAMALDFSLHPDALRMISSKVDSLTSLQPVDIRNPYYLKTLQNLVSKETIDQMTEQTNLFGSSAELPEDLRHTLFLTHVRFVWNTMTSSYQSEGKIGIGNIDGKPLNVFADGYIEIQKKRSGDMMDIYLKFDDDNWYYFGYTRGVMQVLSSDRAMLDIFRDLSPNQRRLKVPKNETPYIYMVGVDMKLSRFLRKMEMRKEPPPGPEEEEKSPTP